MFASFASLVQVANWLATSARISAGVVARGSPPMLSSLSLTSGTETARRVMPLSLTFDHRVVTGGEAARFLVALKSDLERAS